MKKKRKFYARRERNRKRLWDVSYERERAKKNPPTFTQTTNIANRSCSCLFFSYAAFTNELREKKKVFKTREREREKIFQLYAKAVVEEGGEKNTQGTFFLYVMLLLQVYMEENLNISQRRVVQQERVVS
jgi:hypothetical protein